ncbi:MAG: hypothetical protein K5753_02830 [Clostridia bacterium]|nr:hypothetical protein [Clostridia bacterium]
MAYILSSGGDTDFTNCTSLPSVQNSSGRIMFKNDSSHKGTIKEVISSGTYISFGTSGSDNYQTVTGNVDWYGNRSGSWGIDGWKTNNKANTVINGYLNAYGTGNVWFGYKLGGNLALMNTGTASLAVGRIGGKLLVNKAASKPVSSLTWDSGASVAGQAILYGTKNGNLSSVTTGGTVGEDLYCDGFSSVTVSGKVSGTLVGMSCDTITSNAELNSARMQLNGGTFISNKKCSGNVLSFNSHLTINADVGGNVALTADIFGFWCELGTMSKTITVGGTIKVRGVLVDNSHNKSTINVSGFYFGDVMKEWNECGQLSYTVENGGFCLITSPKKNPDDYPNACKMNSRLDIKGWLILISYSSSRKMHFYGDVYCNALTANTTAFSHNGNLGAISSAFGRVSSSVRDCGGNVWSGASTSTSKSLIYFHKPVFVKNDDENTYLGVCHAANCNFAAGSTLITDGQVCLTSCYLTSKGFESSTGRHCFTNGNQVTDYKDSSGAWRMDGSLFAHRYADSTGINVLSNVETESNVCFYNGYTYLLDGTNLKGVQIAASSNGTGVTGSIYSKMFYFGAGLELSGTSSARSRISSVPPKYEHTTPQARTIIWVETGNLSVGENCYIGKWVTKSQMTSGTEYLPAKELSSNPGVFVTAGAAWVHGTCTLDICAYDGIVVEKSGVVSGKDYQSSGTRYFAGFYLTAGYIYVKKTDGNWYTGKSNNADDLAGFFGYFKCKENGRNFWASNTGDGPTDRSAYRPDGAKYASMLASNVNRSTTQNYNSIYYTPNGSNEKITNIKSSGVVSATLKELKRNNFTPYSIPNPFPTRLSVRSNPAKPSVTGEEDASGGQMAKLDIKISVEPWAKGTLSFGEASISPTKVNGPINVADFQKQFSVEFEGAGGSVKKQSSSQSGLKHPSSMWTDSVAKNFDEQNEDYWNVRLIPYVWTLPYANSNALSGYNNPSKRVLNMKYQESVGINLKWENAKVTEGGQTYLLAEKAWNGSGLKSEIGDIVSSLKNSKGEIVYDGIKRRSTSGEDRITDILVFESGELDYDAFVMGQGDDYANWNRSTRTSQASSSSVSVWGFTIPLDSTKWYSIPHSGLHGNHMKDVMRSPQWAWYQGGPIGSYDIVWYFFACENPLDPYGSKPKDLHVIMPQGYGLEWYYDNENTFTVIGKGRVFLYFTSGNSFYFYGKNTDSTKPFGTVRKVDGKYQPQLYIIGAGTNIDFILDGMPFYAYAYMPFGWSTDLYYPQGSLGVLNTWNDLANPGGFFGTSKYTKNANMQTTPVNRNALTLGVDNGGKKRLIVGKYVVDNFYYAPNGSNKLTFVKAAPPDLSDTTIYSRSVMKNGKMTFGTGTKYSLSTFMTLPPNFSTQMLDWKYVSIRVEG